MIVSEFISNRYESICSLKLHEALREMNTTRANNKGILPFSKYYFCGVHDFLAV